MPPRLLATGLLIAAMAATVAAEETVRLRSGAAIQGEILARKPDRLIIDLGYDVLSIPMEAVLRIEGPGPADAADRTPAEASTIFWTDPGRQRLSVEENLGRCSEAVVEIRTPVGLGSGFFIHPSGYVVTNDHVIVGEHKISITVFRQGEHELSKVQYHDVAIIATNSSADLALLKIRSDETDFPSVPLGESDEVRQGERVFAVGSPLGLERSVSQGIVSVRNRALNGLLFIQNTTEINPGNSGGPLFNLRGEVVGINDLKIAGAGLEGLGFSIAVDTLKGFLRNLDAFAFDPRNPNSGFVYLDPPSVVAEDEP